MDNFKIVKKGIELHFRNPRLKGLNELTFEYKIVGHKENENNDGFYYNATYNRPKKAIMFYAKINGKQVDGVGLTDEINNKINALYEELKAKRKENGNVVDGVTLAN